MTTQSDLLVRRLNEDYRMYQVYHPKTEGLWFVQACVEGDAIHIINGDYLGMRRRYPRQEPDDFVVREVPMDEPITLILGPHSAGEEEYARWVVDDMGRAIMSAWEEGAGVPVTLTAKEWLHVGKAFCNRYRILQDVL